MAIMAMDMVRNKKYFLISITLATFSSQVLANEFFFDPTIKLNGTYSDNVNYDNSNVTSSFVNQLGIGIKSQYFSKGTSFNIEAESASAFYTHDHDLDDNYLTLTSNINIQLWPNGLSLIGSANIQNLASNTDKNLYSDLISGDVVQVEQYSGGLSYNLNNGEFNLQSSLVYNTTISDDRIGEQEGYSGNISSQNGQNSKYLFWNISSNYTERNNNNRKGTSYQNEMKVGYITPYKIVPFLRYYNEDNSGTVGFNRTTESNSYGAGFRWLATPRFVIDLSYNTPNSSSENQEQDDYLDVEINWQPTIRTTLNAGISQRFYGDSYDLNLQHKNKRLTNTISYNESVKAFTRDNTTLVFQGLFWCPKSDNPRITDCFISDNQGINFNNYELQPISDFEIFEDDDYSLNKIINWTSKLELSRTSLSFNLSQIKRINLQSNEEALQESVRLDLSREISGYSTITLSSNYTEKRSAIDLSFEREDRYRIYKIDYNRKLNRSLSFTVGLSHLNRSSDPAIYVYKENRIKLEINKVL